MTDQIDGSQFTILEQMEQLQKMIDELPASPEQKKAVAFANQTVTNTRYVAYQLQISMVTAGAASQCLGAVSMEMTPGKKKYH